MDSPMEDLHMTAADLTSPVAGASSSSAPASPLRPLLILHVSMGKSAHVISAALVDPVAHKMALGCFEEEVSATLVDALSSPVANAAPSPLLTLLQQHASHSDVLLYLDEKRLSVPEILRINSIVSTAVVPGASINAIAKPAFLAQSKVMDDLRKQLDEMLQGGMAPWFIAIDAHLGPAASKLDSTCACLAVALTKIAELAGLTPPTVLGPGEWTLGSLKAGASGFMLVDPAAQAALNLWPHVSVAENKDKNSSLHGLLNKGRTAMSGRKIDSWIRQPLLDPVLIERRLDFVEIFTSSPELRARMYDQALKKIPDLDVTLKKLQAVGKGSKLDSNKCIELWVQLYNVTQDRTPGILGALSDYSGVHASRLEREMLKPLSAMLSEDLALFGKFMRETVDLHAASRGEYRINSSVNGQLGAIAERMHRAEKAMDAARSQAEDDLGLHNHVKLIQNPLHGWVFRIVRKDENALRESSGYTHLETRKDGAYFTCKDLRMASDAMKKAEAEYAVEQEAVVETGMSVTLSYVEVFVQLNAIITELDVFVSLAHVAANATTEYVRPTLLPMGSKDLVLIKARHPCVEMMAATGDQFIPNDVVMEKGRSNVQIMTGPNMGGKSTYIRQVGVIQLMCQIGCFVPCESARVPIVDSILARVGAGDSQQKGMSTFMAEMLEASNIIKSASSNSLCIIDELGRGTSTYDGFGLAWAITEHLATNTNCFAFFATHFAELTALTQSHANVKNLHVSAHVDKHSISMQYTVLPGVSTRSFGVHVASVAHFPKIVVDMAREKAMELEAFGGGEQTSMAVPAAAAAGSVPSASPPSSQGDQTVGSVSGMKRVSTSVSPAARSDESHLGIPVVDPSEVAVAQPEWMCELLNHAPDFVDAVGEQDAEALGAWIENELAKKFPQMPRPSNAKAAAAYKEETKEMEF